MFVIELIGQLSRDVICCLSVKPWCYWVWGLLIWFVRLMCLIPSTYAIQLTFILKMTTAQVVETSVTVSSSLIRDYALPDDHACSAYLKIMKWLVSLNHSLLYSVVSMYILVDQAVRRNAVNDLIDTLSKGAFHLSELAGWTIARPVSLTMK